MRLSILQYALHWADKAKNLQLFQERLAAIAGKTELAILPEMFTTGFCTHLPELAEGMEDNTIAQLKQWAANYNMAIAGTFLATDRGRLCNRAFFVTPQGHLHYADKRHLFSLGGEDKHFSKGEKRLVVEYLGVKFCLLVCYDLRFPVWSRNQSGADYDVLIYVANFPTKRIADWDTLLPARAIENQSYVVGANCVGTDGLGIQYNGHSALFDTRCKKIVDFEEAEEGTKTGTIDIERLHQFRAKFPVWQDADTFLITK